jgi:hypothetical protein
MATSHHLSFDAGYLGAAAGTGFGAPFGWQHEAGWQQLTGQQQTERQQRLGWQHTGLQQLAGSQHVVAQGLQQVVTQQGSQQQARCRLPADAGCTANSHTAVTNSTDITIRRIALAPHG